MGKINIKINKGGIKNVHLNNVQDGPELSDIKESRGRKKIHTNTENAPRILKIKEKKRREIRKRKFEFKISYIIALFFLIILGIAFYFGYNFLKKDRILRILPENTVFYGKVDLKKAQSDYNEGTLGQIIETMSSKDEFSQEMAKIIDNQVLINYGLNFKADILGEIKDEISLASFRDSESKENLHTILALEVEDSARIGDIINKSANIDYINNYLYEGSDIYEIVFKNEKNNFYYAFSSNFLILAKDDRALENILAVSAKKKTSLASSQTFRDAVPYLYRLENNYFYTNLSSVAFDNIEDFDLFGLKFNKSFVFYAFLKKAGPMSFYFAPDSNGLNLYAHSIKQEEKNIEAGVTHFALDKSSVVYSGYSLGEDIAEYVDMFSEEDKNVSFIKNIAGALESEYNLNLGEDIKPFFEKESEISIISEEKKDELVIALKVQNNNANKKKMTKVEKAISHYFGIMYPTDREFELADGSIGFELFANDKAHPFKDVKLGDVKIRSIVNPNIKQHYAYAFYKDYLLLSTQEKLLEEAIQAEQSSKNLINSEDYGKILNGRVSDNSLFYLDLSRIYDKIETSENGFLNRFKKFVLTQENKINGTDFMGTFLVE
ncbi:MAG: DUF3352 domain-containing protein [Parcubacteria group bacterium]|nr:DUF3352 domain-containing protein [Parcubacteria group bacterium]